MLSQPTPAVTERDVERIVRRDFSQELFDAVMGILNEYGVEKWHRERPRVQLAVLKIANKKMKDLRSLVEAAKSDYRDVLREAEYPGYAKRSFRDMQTLPTKEQQQIIESDWRQYEAWLKAAPE